MFTTPTFNLPVNIWRYQFPPPAGLPDVVTVANLQSFKRTQNWLPDSTFLPSVYCSMAYLLLPAGTDVQSTAENPLGGDTVECPAGSGRFYGVWHVDDVAKGFANEYRVAVLQKYPGWPVPIP